MASGPKSALEPGQKTETSGLKKWTVPVILVSFLLTGAILWEILTASEMAKPNARMTADVLEQFDGYLENRVEHFLSDFSGVERKKTVYRLEDKNLVAPAPVPENYGTAESAQELAWLLEEAKPLLDGQETLFTTETEVKDGCNVRYYLDETIFAVTWKEAVDGSAYTISEVKVAHPSQFRRFLSEGVYGSGIQRTTTDMSQSVNAVVASSGDYYEYREIGIVVNEGQTYRTRGELLDTCYIDSRGDLLFTYAGELTGREAVEQFVKEHDVRFSLAFGPVMIEADQVVVPPFYNSGEINKEYPRSALCQLGPLHYCVVMANMEDPCYSLPTMKQFAENLHAMGIPRAYALDGGQTAAIAMDSCLINTVSYVCQREISDIIYFATALPEQS